MFNHLDYEKRLDAMKEQLRNDPAPAWLPTVSKRYAGFLLGNVQNRLSSTKALMSATTTDQWPVWANDIRDLAGILYNAAMLISGQVSVTYAIKAEAEMRLFEEANRPTTPVPEHTESDADYRLRVVDVARAAGEHDLQREAYVALGKCLDDIGAKFGVERIST